MKLQETVKLMDSEDFKERFKAEYLQLLIRVKGLETMLVNYKKGSLKFKPKCSYDLLNGQLKVMYNYMNYLEERAEIEGITLVEVEGDE